MDPFDQFMTETLTLHKANGTVIENIKASVRQNGAGIIP